MVLPHDILDGLASYAAAGIFNTEDSRDRLIGFRRFHNAISPDILDSSLSLLIIHLSKLISSR